MKYLSFTLKEKETIAFGNAINLFHYREREQEFIKKAEAYGKVIVSFDQLYSRTVRILDEETECLKIRINKLKKQLLDANKANREALEFKLGSIKKELDELLKKKNDKPSPFRNIANPSFIDTSA